MEKNERHELEDYEPGSTREEVFDALRTVASKQVDTKKKAQKPSQPRQASS